MTASEKASLSSDKSENLRRAESVFSSFDFAPRCSGSVTVQPFHGTDPRSRRREPLSEIDMLFLSRY